MKDFLTKIWAGNKSFESFEISIFDIEMVKDSVVKALSLRDYFQLKDKAEGVAYLDRTIKKTAPYLFFNKKIGIEVPPLYNSDLSKYDTIIIKEILYQIIVICFGETPEVKLENEGLPCLIFIQKNAKIFYFCGLIEPGTYGYIGNTINFKKINFKVDLKHFDY